MINEQAVNDVGQLVNGNSYDHAPRNTANATNSVTFYADGFDASGTELASRHQRREIRQLVEELATAKGCPVQVGYGPLLNHLGLANMREFQKRHFRPAKDFLHDELERIALPAPPSPATLSFGKHPPRRSWPGLLSIGTFALCLGGMGGAYLSARPARSLESDISQAYCHLGDNKFSIGATIRSSSGDRLLCVAGTPLPVWAVSNPKPVPKAHPLLARHAKAHRPDVLLPEELELTVNNNSSSPAESPL